MNTTFLSVFSQNLRVQLRHPLTGHNYTLLRAVEVAAVCNEPLVYDGLFRARRQGQPYAVTGAEAF
ncbi:hypothetical protein GCM10010840_08790 [Deinococcus aerolatus]|uniref:Uncharacterized protein n=1 Tax=Deinococcus aerolatus TaxID=522487 RepID=A0ABQ2G3L9_9DEIO|nr:hypothetical protein [Deinococcus aerolatus]GGL72987.1 hypothetical protein GCM10010840_08790 [Deinococcus aerolatus]